MKQVRPWLLWLLMGLTAGRHYLVDVLAQMWADPDRARRGLFYIAAGIQGACLYTITWVLLPVRPYILSRGAALACWWGILEESQVAVCRAMIGVETARKVTMWRGICDDISGWPISTVTLLAPVCILWYIYKNVD